LILALVAVIGGCGGATGLLTPGGSDGPIMTICGTNIGRAEDMAGDGPFYVDASHGSPSASVRAAAGTSPINVRVSPDCAVGAEVSASNRSVIRPLSEIRSADHAQEVISVFPLAAGRAVLTIRRGRAKPVNVTFLVGPPTSVPNNTTHGN
jgi:hypothetical protein